MPKLTIMSSVVAFVVAAAPALALDGNSQYPNNIIDQVQLVHGGQACTGVFLRNSKTWVGLPTIATDGNGAVDPIGTAKLASQRQVILSSLGYQLGVDVDGRVMDCYVVNPDGRTSVQQILRGHNFNVFVPEHD